MTATAWPRRQDWDSGTATVMPPSSSLRPDAVAVVLKLPSPSSLSTMLYADALPVDQPSATSGRTWGAVGSGFIVPTSSAAATVWALDSSMAARTTTGSGSFTEMLRAAEAPLRADDASVVPDRRLDGFEPEISDAVLWRSPMPMVERSTLSDADAGCQTPDATITATTVTAAAFTKKKKSFAFERAPVCIGVAAKPPPSHRFERL